MVNQFNESSNERLKQAESAEKEIARLERLASEAPQLRLQKIKAERAAERQRTKEGAMARAKSATQSATDKQRRMPEVLGQAAHAVVELYTLLKDVDTARHQAMEALAIADRVDYDIELEESEEHERSLDRDTRGLAYALAARHGDAKVKQMLEELDPDFTMLRGCDLEEPLYRDVADFVVRHAVPQVVPPATLISQTATIEAAEIEPEVDVEAEAETEAATGPDD